MKNVLMLIKGLGRGGAEQLILNSLPYLDRDRYRFEIAYLLPHKDALVTLIEDAGIPVTCLTDPARMGWVRRLRKLVKEREIDLVHAHSPVAASIARVALGSKGPRFLYTEHNAWPRYHRATYWANATTYWRNDHVITVSNSVKESIRYPHPLRLRSMPTIETIYHGPDPTQVIKWTAQNGVREELGIPHDAPVIGTVANFKTHKGYRFLCDAALEVRKAVPNVRFVFVGQGPLEEEVRRYAKELGLDGSVIFTGFAENAPRLTSSFDMFVLASLHEGLSIALIEALSLGKPAVVTSVGGLPEVIQTGAQGLVVPPKDSHALSEAILTLIRDPKLRTQMGVAALERASHFDIRNAVRRVHEIYEELV